MNVLNLGFIEVSPLFSEPLVNRYPSEYFNVILMEFEYEGNR
jgi:hypothetical protein